MFELQSTLLSIAIAVLPLHVIASFFCVAIYLFAFPMGSTLVHVIASLFCVAIYLFAFP